MIVFVSYSSVNREAVEALVLQLGELGHDVEYEMKFIGAPVTWQHVFASIKNCDLFITAVTNATLVSVTCEIEYQYAHTLNKNILAVLLENIRTEDLPDMTVKGLVDFRANRSEAQAALAGAIAALPAPIPAPMSPIPLANWVTPLAELRQRIEALPRDAAEQNALVHNINEFLERRESFEAAKSLLELLAVQKGLREQTLSQIEFIRDEFKRVRSSTREARRRRTFVRALILSSVVALVAVILSQLFFRFRADYNTALALTKTAESSAALVIISSATILPVNGTNTLVPAMLPSLTSFVTPLSPVTETPVPTSVILLSTNTPITPTSTFTHIPTSTATQVPPTVTPLPSFTPITPTATLTLSPSPTRIPPTSTTTLVLSPTSTLGIAFLATTTPTANLTGILLESVYVGLIVEDTPLGLKVNDVGDVAQSSGVQVGDYVLAVDLDTVTSSSQFLKIMQTRNPFSRITLRVRRANGINIITLVLGPNDFVLATRVP